MFPSEHADQSGETMSWILLRKREIKEQAGAQQERKLVTEKHEMQVKKIRQSPDGRIGIRMRQTHDEKKGVGKMRWKVT